jgi:hypothetical protein
MKTITVKEGLLPLNLRPDTLALMAKRDSLGRGPRYKAARNKVTAMVRRDKEMSNLAKLVESVNSQLSHRSLGDSQHCGRQTAPATPCLGQEGRWH